MMIISGKKNVKPDELPPVATTMTPAKRLSWMICMIAMALSASRFCTASKTGK